jgi:hypothetical protein
MRWLCTFVMITMAFASAPTRAATIAIEEIENDSDMITIVGDLEFADGQKFANTVTDIHRAIVAFASRGGSVAAGLRIGKIIRLRNFATVVPDHVLCASACALAWLGGTRRFMGLDAKIGFHAACSIEGGSPAESGVANALVGSYLSGLGLPDEVVIYVTSAHPDEIRWLSLDDAQEIGVNVALLPPMKTEPNSPAGIPPTEYPPQRPTIGLTLEQTAQRFLETYFGRWSENNVTAMGHFEGLYADQVTFYGRTVSKQAIIDIKRKFVERWPDRLYTVSPGSVSITCDYHDLSCLISSLVQWDCRSISRGERSTGLANFTVRVIFPSSGSPRIVSETGSVVSRSLGGAQSVTPQSNSPAFSDGLRDRQAWESWFSTTVGDFHQGVSFWGGERSKTQPLSCNSLSSGPAFFGCLAAKERLTPSDKRRRAEPDYRAGWNSY